MTETQFGLHQANNPKSKEQESRESYIAGLRAELKHLRDLERRNGGLQIEQLVRIWGIQRIVEADEIRQRRNIANNRGLFHRAVLFFGRCCQRGVHMANRVIDSK